jgi:hypothetical protein
MTSLAEKERVLAGAAPSVKDRPGNLLGRVDKRFLRPADFPRRKPSVHILENTTIRNRHVLFLKFQPGISEPVGIYWYLPLATFPTRFPAANVTA